MCPGYLSILGGINGKSWQIVDGAIPGGVRRRAPRALGAIPVRTGLFRGESDGALLVRSGLFRRGRGYVYNSPGVDAAAAKEQRGKPGVVERPSIYSLLKSTVERSRTLSSNNCSERSSCGRGYSGADGAIPGGVRRRAPRALGAIPVRTGLFRGESDGALLVRSGLFRRGRGYV